MREPEDSTISLTAVLLAAVCLTSAAGQAQYTGGSGTAQDPYRLATAADLLALGDSPQDYDKHFILTADIDLDPNLAGGRVFDRAVLAPYEDPLRPAPQALLFSGVFDGRGHRITNLTVSGDGYLGLFGCLAQGAVVVNLGLEDVNVVGTGDRAGGLAGYNEATICNSYSTGTVRGTQYVGGLVGDNHGTIANTYNASAVRGNEAAGGLVGENQGAVSNSYSTGAVTGGHSAGGLVGRSNGGAVLNSFWDTTTSRRPTSAGGTGLTTAQMQQQGSFTGWGFVGEQVRGVCEIWQIPPGGGYPVLSVFHGYTPPELEGDGSLEQPYLVKAVEDLGAVWYRPAACYQLASDIDLSATPASIPVIPVFAGRFDGQGRRIVNLSVSGGGAVGLFGCLTRGATVTDLSLEGVDVVGTGDWVGSLAGCNWGTISNTRSTGSISGMGWSVGGLVGENNGTISGGHSEGTVGGTGWSLGGLAGSNWGTVANSSSTASVSGVQNIGGFVGENRGAIEGSRSAGTVTGFGYAGGLVGSNWGTVLNTYSTSAVSSNEDVGGLVGWNAFGAIISNSYSTGAVTGAQWAGGLVGYNDATVANCFWDTLASGRTTSAGGTGKATAEMQKAATFLSAGWDFTGETTNGTEDLWWIDEGHDYPRLGWEAAR
jgi:hypothetical protein